jgi:uncharacterized membrane protein
MGGRRRGTSVSLRAQRRGDETVRGVNFFGDAIPAVWLALSGLASGWLLIHALRGRPWRWLESDSRQHAYAGSIVACMLLWTIAGKLGAGPSFHMLGMTILTLMFGPGLAFLGAVLALTGVSAAGLAGWEAFGLNALLMGAVPVASSYVVYRWADRRLPNHFFVYVLVSAFLNGAFAMIASRLAAMLVLWLAGTGAASVAPGDYIVASVLLAWGEALTSGMIVTIFVVYRPAWVRLFDDARYIVGR